jgi:TatD DNase family protein
MIDVHCHLEQKDYDKERGKIVEQCKRELKAIVTCCAHPKDIGLTLDMAKEHRDFIFCSIGIHPEFIKELKEQDIDETIKAIEQNKNLLAGIGEVGLDYFWIKEPEWQEKQKELFRKMIQLAKKLNKPLVIHSRNASEDTIGILEEEGMKGKKVLLHLFCDRKFLQRVVDDGWFISIGPGIMKSKDIRKIARDMPLNKIMLETDSPWFNQEGQKYGTPLNVKIACEKIAEIKKINILEVEKQTDLNAIGFFGLDIK